MRNSRLLSSVAFVTLLTAAVALARQAVGAQGGGPTSLADEYIPTRLEWLALVGQASLRHEATADPYHAYTLAIVQKGVNTILIYVRYDPTGRRDIMNRAIETAKYVLRTHAKGYGWDSRLEIVEDVALFDVK